MSDQLFESNEYQPMKTIKFKGLLQNNKWIAPAFVTIDENGKFISVSSFEEGVPNETVDGYVLPGFQNAHSHAFQYAMAGLAEIHKNPSQDDDFWSWRNTMYQIALYVSPDHLEAIAAMLYTEMLRHGYTSVAEFHYLHHDQNGKQYSNLSEMGERLISAANSTGIKITLVPMFYQMGGFGKKPESNQRRFISSSVADYEKLLEASLKSVKNYSGANLGMGIHSLRAVESKNIKEAVEQLGTDKPIHFHVSEQLKEIEDAKAYLKMRPVEWMLENLDLNDNFHLVHATHINDQEILGIAKAKANVVLCPSTEGNLGDGLFPLKNFQNSGGNWSIGTDSHIGLNPLEELRILDYGQRLISHKRNQFISNEQGNTGHFAFDMSLKAGRKAMTNNSLLDYFAPGQDFDAVIINGNSPLLHSCGLDKILPTLIYSGDISWILGTMIKGSWVVKNQEHISQNATVDRFCEAIQTIGIRS